MVNYETLDGRWYQQGMPVSTTSARNLAATIGVTGPIVARTRWGVDWHADYVFMGRSSASCQCTTDALYNNVTHTALPGAMDDTAHFTGSGNIQGFVLSVEPYYMFGAVRLASEIGGFFNHYTWNEYVAGGAHGWRVNRLQGLDARVSALLHRPRAHARLAAAALA